MGEDLDEDEAAVIVMCQGPPRCDLTGDLAEAAMMAGCIWCERHEMEADGTLRITKPVEA